MWRMETVVVPVVVGELGTMSKYFQNYIRELPKNICCKEIQKIALLGTAHIKKNTLN